MPASNTYDTTNPGSAVGNTEDLQRGAHLIAPQNSPVYSTLDKVKAKATFHEWILDDLADVDKTTTPYGADATAFSDAFEGQVKVGNYVGRIDQTVKVDDVQELVDSAGGVDFAGATKKALIQLNRNTEALILGTQARDAGSKSTAATPAGFAEMLSGSSGVFTSEYQCPTASVSTSSVSEDSVNAVIRSIFIESGETANLRVYAAPQWVQDLSDATVRLTDSSNSVALQVKYDGKQIAKSGITSRVRIYEGQHGAIEVFDLNPATVNDTTNYDEAFFINPSYACVAELGGLVKMELPNLGGGRRMLLKRNVCPVVKNPRAHGYFSES